ncbi:hypothetical protein JTE90_015998 [Oedothorax gibbosus]|uniref:MIP18 family-like domain-containing protein n=1 Tax=Oedothorax gibbosus TaxID=931172 RepID=A0AAV6VQR3_9ARAC|nr:hypothetical protein JTE90_015998 [Oedothorax gibbosus]
MNGSVLENAYPEMHERIPDRVFTCEDFQKTDLPIDAREVFDHVRDIKDPEHPMTLEELHVVELELIQVDDATNKCDIQFKPTIPHCSMATLIGLAIKVQLLRLLPARFKIDVSIVPGTHVSAAAINKQLADKERIAAALENKYLHKVINDCILFEFPQDLPKFVEKAVNDTNNLEQPKIEYIQHSRQHIESYRRWRDILYGDVKKWKSSLMYLVEKGEELVR